MIVGNQLDVAREFAAVRRRHHIQDGFGRGISLDGFRRFISLPMGKVNRVINRAVDLKLRHVCDRLAVEFKFH